MQVYQYKLGTADARYDVCKNGFKLEVNGATFTEVENRETKKHYILAELPDGKGVTKYDIMSIENWTVIRHNGDAIARCVKGYTEGVKARAEASIAELKKQVTTLKGVGLQPAAILAALMAQGNASSDIQEAMKA